MGFLTEGPPQDAGEETVRAGMLDLDGNGALAVDGATDDNVALALGDGLTTAGASF